MAQNREKVLLGIYTHGRQKASKSAIFRGVSFRTIELDNIGQIMTILDKTGQIWTNLDKTVQNPETVNYILCWRGASTTHLLSARAPTVQPPTIHGFRQIP